MKSRNGVIAVIASLALSVGVRAEVPSLVGPVLKWERPVLGAQRLPDARLDESRVPGQVRIFTREEIEASGVRTIQELLRNEAGVNVFDTIGNSFQQTVDVRGFNATPVPLTQVIVDGVRVNENSFGQVNFHLIPLEDIEQLEVHYGPNTKFGRGALAGVIHVTTRRGTAERVSADAGLSYGSYNRKKGDIAVRGVLSGFDYSIIGVKELDDGYRDNARVQVSNLKAKLGYKAGESQDAWLSYQRTDDRIQQPGSITEAEFNGDPQQFVSNVNNISHMDFVGVGHRIALPYDLSASWNGFMRERKEVTPLNRGRTSVSQSQAEMKSRGLVGQVTHDALWGARRVVTSVGVETRFDESDAAAKGAFGASPFHNSNVSRDRSFALYGETVFDLLPEKLVLTTGLRYDEARIDYEESSNSNWAFGTKNASGEQAFHRTNPRVGLNFTPSDRFRSWISYGEAFRIPTFSEITGLGPVAQNPLLPVRSKSVEIGAKANLTDAISIGAAGFRTEVRDEIYFDPTQGAFGENRNIDRTRRIGVDWTLEAKKGRWEGRFNHAWTQATFESAFSLSRSGGGNQSVQDGDRMPMVPEHKAVLGAVYKPGKGLRLSADEVCVGDQFSVGDEANVDTPQRAYCETNLGVRYAKGSWSAFANGFNVLDHRHGVRSIYSTVGGARTRFLTPASGANVQVGVSYRFTSGPEVVARKLSSIVEVARAALR